RQRLQARAVELGRVRRNGVGHDRSLEALVEGAARRVLDADLRDSAGDEHRVDVAGVQQVGQARAMEPVVAVLVDLVLAGPQLERDWGAVAHVRPEGNIRRSTPRHSRSRPTSWTRAWTPSSTTSRSGPAWAG